MQPVPPQSPKAWRQRLEGFAWQTVAIGRSAAAVHRLVGTDGTVLFGKSEPAGAFCALPGEAARLRWLGANGIACPDVLDEVSEGGQHRLLLSAVAGRNLVEAGLTPESVVEIVVAALRRLHALPPASCPFDHRAMVQIEAARARLDAGLVDESDFDAERLGIPAAELMRRLTGEQPADEDLVVAHGDASLPNLLADRGVFSGFVDCGRLGVSDRHRDLALAARSIRYNLGQPWDEVFLSRYGGEIDRDRLAWFRLLDEFF